MRGERSFVDRVNSWASGVRRTYERGATSFESGVQLLERRYTPLGRFTPGPFEGWSFLWQPAVLGFVALTAILAGSSFTNSPFKFNLTSTWFFGEPAANAGGTPSETKYILSVVLVYGGLLLLMRVWLRLSEVLKLHGGVPLKKLWWIFAMWAVPMVVAPPLFSRDVFSYAAQGEMTLAAYQSLSLWSLHPRAGIQRLDVAGRPALGQYAGTLRSVLPLHRQHDCQVQRAAPTRHGRGTAPSRSGRGRGNRLRRRSCWRAVSDRDPGEAFVLAAMNPLVLLTLIGGAHNDALMTAFLVIGLGLAVQAPSGVGAVLRVARDGDQSTRRDRARLRRVELGAAQRLAQATDSALRHRWRRGGGGAGRDHLDGGLWLWLGRQSLEQRHGAIVGRARDRCGYGDYQYPARRRCTRHRPGFGALGHAILGGGDRGGLHALAALAVPRAGLGSLAGLGAVALRDPRPVVQPWYLAWGLVVLAASYEGREHFWLLLLSIVGPFIGLPGGRQLLAGLVHSNPLLIALAVAILGGVLISPMGRWTQWSWPEGETGSRRDYRQRIGGRRRGPRAHREPGATKSLSPEAAT